MSSLVPFLSLLAALSFPAKNRVLFSSIKAESETETLSSWFTMPFGVSFSFTVVYLPPENAPCQTSVGIQRGREGGERGLFILDEELACLPPRVAVRRLLHPFQPLSVPIHTERM